MNKCPSCNRSGKIRKSRPRTSLERSILPALQLRPYYCESCGGRFYGLRSNSHSDSRPKLAKPKEGLFSEFLTSQDSPDFQELIQEIGEAEKRMGLTKNKPKNR